MSEPSPNPPTTTTSSAAPSRPAQAARFARDRDRLRPRLSSEGARNVRFACWRCADDALLDLRFLPYNAHRHLHRHDAYFRDCRARVHLLFAIVISVIGVFVATRTANYLGKKDPQIVVIDEVSGQLISYFGIGARGCSTGNICCWALYFFVSSIFGSRSPRGKPNRSPAAWESWRMIGSREFTRRWACGSRGRSGFRFVALAFRRACA